MFLNVSRSIRANTVLIAIIASMLTAIAAPSAANALSYTSISPSSGPTSGGTRVTIKGSGFTEWLTRGMNLYLGDGECLSATLVDSSTLTCTTAPSGRTGSAMLSIWGEPDWHGPPGPPQMIDVLNAFTFLPPPLTYTSISPTTGPTAGGTRVTIKGSGFSDYHTWGGSISLGDGECLSATLVDSSTITCTTSASQPGRAMLVIMAEVVFSNPPTVPQPLFVMDAFTFEEPVVISSPTITSVSPNSATTPGGTSNTITGTGFVAGATVTVDGAACTSVVVVSATSITCITPAGTLGEKDVVVSNADSGTFTSPSSFTYTKPFYAVTFKANGGSGTLVNSSKNTASALPSNSFVRAGYVFNGWNTNAKGTGTAYADRASYSFEADLSLYAQWTAVESGPKLKKYIAIFAGDQAALTNPMKSAIAAWVKKLPKNANITCVGSTQGAKVAAFDRKLATSRAKSVCDELVKARPDLKYTLKVNPSSSLEATARSVWIYQE